jgi:hypothetical protein
MKLHEEFKLYENMWENSPKTSTAPIKEAATYTEKDFAWDDATIVADFKRAALAYMNGTNLEDALHDIKVMIISGACSKLDPVDTKGFFRSECAKYGITEAVNKDTLQETDNWVKAPAQAIQVLNIETKTDNYGPKNSARHYDLITFIDPEGFKRTTSKFEGKPGYKEWFGWDGKAYDYEGNFVPGIDPMEHLSPATRGALHNIVKNINK